MCIIIGAAARAPAASRRARLNLPAGVALALAAAVLLSVACGGAPVQTSAGTTVPADVVLTQDAVGDALNILEEAHNASVAKHDATPICGEGVPAPCDTGMQHAARRRTLQTNAAALRSGWRGLKAWKVAGSDKPGPGLFCELVKAAPDLLSVATSLNAIKPEAADTVRKVVGVLGYGCVS